MYAHVQATQPDCPGQESNFNGRFRQHLPGLRKEAMSLVHKVRAATPKLLSFGLVTRVSIDAELLY